MEAVVLGEGRWPQAEVGVLATRSTIAAVAPLADLNLTKAESRPLPSLFASELRTECRIIGSITDTRDS